MSVVFITFGIGGLCLIGVRLSLLYPALGIPITWVVIVGDVVFFIILTVISMFGIIYLITLCDKSTSRGIVMKLKADDLLNHFEHYFSENSKEFEKILSPENISVKFKFSLGEKKNEKVEFTAQGNKREVQVSKWVVGKVRFYSSEYIKKKDRNENNENAFNPFNIDRIGEEGPMP